MPMSPLHSKKRLFLLLLVTMALVYLLLLIPESDDSIKQAVAKPAHSQPFAWKQDAFWRTLESDWKAAVSDAREQSSV